MVNNVGVGYPYTEFFDLLSPETIRNVIHVNIEATMFVTQTIIPKMQKQKRGLILSLSSASSSIPTCPLLAVYGASKAFINNWTVSMNDEYRKDNIRFESLTPFYVTSKLSKIRKSSYFVPDPSKYVRSVLAQVGNYEIYTGYLPHSIIMFFVDTLPNWISHPYILRLHVKTRNIAYKKLNMKKE